MRPGSKAGVVGVLEGRHECGVLAEYFTTPEFAAEQARQRAGEESIITALREQIDPPIRTRFQWEAWRYPQIGNKRDGPVLSNTSTFTVLAGDEAIIEAAADKALAEAGFWGKILARYNRRIKAAQNMKRFFEARRFRDITVDEAFLDSPSLD